MTCVVQSDVVAKKSKGPKIVYENEDGDIKASVSGKIGNTSGLDIHAYLLNKDVPQDKAYATRTVFDLALNMETEKIKSKVGIRSKQAWGSAKVCTTTTSQLKDVDYLDDGHSHVLSQRVLWVKEAYVETNLAKIFNQDDDVRQSFTIGAFPYELGLYGISLGNVFSVNPTTLGFYADALTDQYAFGAKYTTGLIIPWLSQDFYVSIAENKSTSPSETFAQTQAQAFGKKSNPSRGFGKINFIFATAVNANPIKTDEVDLIFQPYFLYNHAPEQNIEFPGDSSSKLYTTGLASSCNFDCIEFSCEGALNFGHQKVQGWDRNVIKKINKNGYAAYVYSDIYNVNTSIVTPASNGSNNVLYDSANSSQKTAVNNVDQSTSSNGQQVGALGIYNSLTRFRPAYTNTYGGYMVVGDISYWLHKQDLKMSYGAGVASGDFKPNANLTDPLSSKVDGTYDGFIGLQQVYAGKTVKSVFLMGAGKVNRPLTSPGLSDGFAYVADGFNNIIYSGFSLNYSPKSWERSFSLNPNVLMYWAHAKTNKFDITLGSTINELASKRLGVEGNFIVNVGLTDDLVIEFMGAVFVPGQHYKDIQGTPFTAAQRKILDASDPTAIPDNLPVLWSDNAYTFSLAMNYSF